MGQLRGQSRLPDGPSHGGPMQYIVGIAHGWAVVEVVPNADRWAGSI
jgi:hypothetical protein